MELLKKFKNNKLVWLVPTFIIGIGLGSIFASECKDPDHEGIEDTVSTLQNTIIDKDDKIETLNREIEVLDKKVEEAEPYFKMNEAEKDSLQIELSKKEEENRLEKERLEDERKKQEELEKQAELDAKSITLGNGTYLVGKDIPAGVYDLYAVKGRGNVISSGSINIIMGISGDEDFYQREQQNAVLKDGDNIDLRSVTIKFVPDDSYSIN